MVIEHWLLLGAVLDTPVFLAWEMEFTPKLTALVVADSIVLGAMFSPLAPIIIPVYLVRAVRRFVKPPTKK